jgi:hypothetical protein
MENTVSSSSSIVACVSVAAETCLPSRHHATDDFFLFFGYTVLLNLSVTPLDDFF